MAAFSAKVTSKGQITVPAEIRRQLGLKPGDRVDFHRGEKGQIEVTARSHRLEDMKGMLPYDGPRLSDDEIVEIVRSARRGMAAHLAAEFEMADD